MVLHGRLATDVEAGSAGDGSHRQVRDRVRDSALLIEKKKAKLDHSLLSRAFNEWQRRYIEEPERFKAEARTIREFLADQMARRVPTYGDECAAYLIKLLGEDPQ